MIRREPVAVLAEAARIVVDDVLAQSAQRSQPGRDGNVVTPCPLDRLLAAGDRHPDRRGGLLGWAWADGHVAVRPETGPRGENSLRPRPAEEVPVLLPTRP